jgi:hypothetical protein
MISITINGDNAFDVQREMHILLNGQGIDAAAATSQVNDPADTPPAAGAGKRPSGRTRAKDAAEKAAAEVGQNISTGEERTDPAADKQDAKDEAAEAKAAAPEPIKLNHDSVRKMLGGYVMAFGMEAAQADGVSLIGTAKISDLADDQAVFAKAVIAIANGIEKNPNKREIAGDGITAEKLAELKPFVAAALAVK